MSPATAAWSAAAIVRRLASENCEVLTVGPFHVDLREQAAVRDWFAANRPDAVVVAAAKVGGILANDTLSGRISLRQSDDRGEPDRGGIPHRASEKLLFLGSSCIYPRMAPQPIPEDALLTGPLEPTNEWYAIAKIAGIKLCQAYRRQYGCDFISAMPTNLYGPGDNFDLANSHVLPALIRKAHEAKLAGAATIDDLGHRHPAPRIPACRRSGRWLRVPDEELFGRGARQFGFRHRPADHRTGANGVRSGRLYRRASPRIPASPMAPRAS